jgi:hypothetical protein
MSNRLRIRFACSLLGGTEADVTGYKDGRLQLASDGNSVPFPLARMPQEDILRLGCALADAMQDDAGIRALAAKLLTANGRLVEAARYRSP